MEESLISLDKAEQDRENIYLKFTLKDIRKIKIDLLKIKLKKGYIKLEYNNNDKTIRTCLRLHRNINKQTVKVRKADRGITVFVQKAVAEIWPHLDKNGKTPLTLIKRDFTREERKQKNMKKIKKKISVENFVKQNLKNMIQQNLDKRSKTLSESRRKRRRRSRHERSVKTIKARFGKNEKRVISSSRSKEILFKKKINLKSEIPILQNKLKNILSSKEDIGLDLPMLSPDFNRGCISSRDTPYKRRRQIKWSKVQKILSIKNFPINLEKVEKIQKLSFLKIFVKELKSNLAKEQSMRMFKERELERRLMNDYIKVGKLEGKIEDRCKVTKTGVRFDGVNFSTVDD